jgi:hypothetical protein
VRRGHRFGGGATRQGGCDRGGGGEVVEEGHERRHYAAFHLNLNAAQICCVCVHGAAQAVEFGFQLADARDEAGRLLRGEKSLCERGGGARGGRGGQRRAAAVIRAGAISVGSRCMCDCSVSLERRVNVGLSSW